MVQRLPLRTHTPAALVPTAPAGAALFCLTVVCAAVESAETGNKVAAKV